MARRLLCRAFEQGCHQGLYELLRARVAVGVGREVLAQARLCTDETDSGLPSCS